LTTYHHAWSVAAALPLLLPVACTQLAADAASLGVGNAHDADGGSDASIADTSTDGANDRAASARDVASTECPDACSSLGASRCVSGTVVQQCVRVGNCLTWATVRDCSDGAKCCDDAGSDAPLADAQADTFDAASQGPDAEAGEPTPDADYYVNVAAPAGGDGTLAHPYTTITAALDRTSADAADGGPTGKRIFVLAGTYSADTGERFPLAVRNGETVTGAGQDRTIVMGDGELDHAAAGGTFNGRYRFTAVVGSHYLATRIAKMTIRSVSPTPMQGTNGILCDQGSKGVGETTLDSIAAGPGYNGAIMAGTTTRPFVSACHLRVVASLVTSGWWGLFASGCGDGEGTAWVDVQVGGAQASEGNVLQWMNSVGTGGGVLLHPCVTGSFRNNQFLDSTSGIVIDQDTQLGTSTFQIVGNRFERLSLTGLDVEGNRARIDDLSDNVFTGLDATLAGLYDRGAVAILLMADGTGPAHIKARRNQFIGNDLGIYLFGTSPMTFDGAAPSLDFGWQEDGGNTFRCNGSAAGGPMDIAVYTGSGTIPFQGNFWDHAPPIALPYGTPAASIDIETDGTVTLDTARAAVSPIPCPAGKVP
jgi:hypothetical protein